MTTPEEAKGKTCIFKPSTRCAWMNESWSRHSTTIVAGSLTFALFVLGCLLIWIYPITGCASLNCEPKTFLDYMQAAGGFATAIAIIWSIAGHAQAQRSIGIQRDELRETQKIYREQTRLATYSYILEEMAAADSRIEKEYFFREHNLFSISELLTFKTVDQIIEKIKNLPLNEVDNILTNTHKALSCAHITVLHANKHALWVCSCVQQYLSVENMTPEHSLSDQSSAIDFIRANKKQLEAFQLFDSYIRKIDIYSAIRWLYLGALDSSQLTMLTHTFRQFSKDEYVSVENVSGSKCFLEDILGLDYIPDWLKLPLAVLQKKINDLHNTQSL
jgi:hypothetical protein